VKVRAKISPLFSQKSLKQIKRIIVKREGSGVSYYKDLHHENDLSKREGEFSPLSSKKSLKQIKRIIVIREGSGVSYYKDLHHEND
jgi:hypothetical protein